MTRRHRLLKAVQGHLKAELVSQVQQWDYIRVQRYTEAIESLERRIPKVVMPPAKISSQYKLF